MKLYLFIFTLIGVVILPQTSAALSGTSYDIAGTKYYSFSNGVSGSSYDIVGTTYYSFSNGISGTAHDIAGTTYYSFTEPVSGYSYDLGNSNMESHPQIKIDLSDISTAITKSLFDYCKGVNSTLYPDYSTRSVLLAAECVRTMCPTEGCDPWDFNSNITICYETGKSKAYNEIRNICVNERAKQYIDLVDSAISLTNSTKNLTTTDVATVIDTELVKRLKGYLLLQTESHGEAWYLNPADGKRYYMKDGPTAYEMMRRFGLGITNTNLAKLPQEGEAKIFPISLNHVKGKILLQVEDYGEAWYVNPKTGARYYMKDGEAAYNLMRFHSLGITNADLEKIPTGNL